LDDFDAHLTFPCLKGHFGLFSLPPNTVKKIVLSVSSVQTLPFTLSLSPDRADLCVKVSSAVLATGTVPQLQFWLAVEDLLGIRASFQQQQIAALEAQLATAARPFLPLVVQVKWEPLLQLGGDWRSILRHWSDTCHAVLFAEKGLGWLKSVSPKCLQGCTTLLLVPDTSCKVRASEERFVNASIVATTTDGGKCVQLVMRRDCNELAIAQSYPGCGWNLFHLLRRDDAQKEVERLLQQSVEQERQSDVDHVSNLRSQHAQNLRDHEREVERYHRDLNEPCNKCSRHPGMANCPVCMGKPSRSGCKGCSNTGTRGRCGQCNGTLKKHSAKSLRMPSAPQEPNYPSLLSDHQYMQAALRKSAIATAVVAPVTLHLDPAPANLPVFPHGGTSWNAGTCLGGEEAI
jgi:hypothetical protein